MCELALGWLPSSSNRSRVGQAAANMVRATKGKRIRLTSRASHSHSLYKPWEGRCKGSGSRKILPERAEEKGGEEEGLGEKQGGGRGSEPYVSVKGS